jgi:hypothetical protein
MVHVLLLRQLVHNLQEIEQRARTPRLRVARVPAVRPIFVRQLRDACPRIVLDVTASREQDLVQVVQCVLHILPRGQLGIHPSNHSQTHLAFPCCASIEIEVRAQKVSQGPTPFRTLPPVSSSSRYRRRSDKHCGNSDPLQ